MILACSQTLYIPSSDNVVDSSAIVELNEGRDLYIKKCASCHNLYRPEKFTKEHWTAQMNEMKVEAKISDAEAAVILKYLTGYKQS